MPDARPKFSIQRFHGGRIVTELPDLCLDHAQKMMLLVWGSCPDDLEAHPVDHEWKFSLGEGHWIVMARTA